VSDIDIAVVDSLKALDPKWPIREADIPMLPNDPVDLGAFAARCRCRFRLMPSQCSHHRDMRHHRIAAMLADQHQHFGPPTPTGWPVQISAAVS
jgi:hypothetical protein